MAGDEKSKLEEIEAATAAMNKKPEKLTEQDCYKLIKKHEEEHPESHEGAKEKTKEKAKEAKEDEAKEAPAGEKPAGGAEIAGGFGVNVGFR